MDECVVSSLVCQENETCLQTEDDSSSLLHFNDDYHRVSSVDDEYLHILIDREIALGFGFEKNQSLVFGNCIKLARLDAINWILKTRSTFGFRFQTAYLSVTYFDRFLSKQSIDIDKYWTIQLLSIACLSLAAKMEELNVPALSEFQLQDYSFESKVIQRMELLVLTTLDWDMGLITPFSFLPYFIQKLCNKSPPSQISSTTMLLIFTIMKEVNLMDHRPSVIAAAAILVALDQQLTVEAVQLKMKPVSHSRFLETEEIYACYNLIRRSYREKTRTDTFVHSKSPSESSLVSSSASIKRTRLTFNDPKLGKSDF